MTRRVLLLFGLALIVVTAGLIAFHVFSPPKSRVLRVATTTSLYATSLLETLSEEFGKEHPGVVVQFIAVGSGEALKRAAKGDADMIFVHAPAAEKKYLEEDVLVDHRIFAYNYFVILGPPDDPAGIKGSTPLEAFVKIYEAGRDGKALFVSRGDNSGTHQREMLLWSRTGLDPVGEPWYLESGSGMAKTLLLANEWGAYTLTDIGTFLKLKVEGKLSYLEVLIDKGELLENVYSVYLVNPSKVPEVNYELAREFADFVTSEKGQSIVGGYGVEEIGQPLFFPALGSEELEEIWEKLSEG